MARVNSAGKPSPRLHIVLVPGFGGFDALGQMEYYAGVTPEFRAWRDRGGERSRAVLHYFDNLPTASVATRAQRLRDYLAKRIARGEFLGDDTIALIGHSTGGLDIRRMIWDLDSAPRDERALDGTQGGAYTVEAREIRDRITHVVFLSVPQWGTNIADWVRTYWIARKLVVGNLYASVSATQVPPLDRVEALLSTILSDVSGLALMCAVRDAINEAETGPCKDGRQTAAAQEAASELSLYLRHMVTDFRAIDDLAAEANGDHESPAHFSDRMRQQEVDRWRNIATQSYATVSQSPFRFAPGRSAPRWDMLNPCSYPEVAKDRALSKATDATYRMCYRACAGGPFGYPSYTGFSPELMHLNSRRSRRIELWDNDGIVNTASMVWPYGKTWLVECDHMDIVGHYRAVEAASPESGRRYDAYDLLGSASKFGPEGFTAVWQDVFDFCLSRRNVEKNSIFVRTSIRTERGTERVYEEPAQV